MQDLGNIANSGFNLFKNFGLPLMKTIGSSLICQWYKENSVVRMRVGEKGYNPTFLRVIVSKSNMTILNMKWDLRIDGAPASQDAFNQSSVTMGRVPTVIAAGLIVHRTGVQLGSFSLDTLEEVSSTRTLKPEDVPLYSQKHKVLIARVRRLYGFDDHFDLEGGFKNGTYPGPLTLQPDDELLVFSIGTNDYDAPYKSIAGTLGFVTGTVSYQVSKPKISSEQLTEEPIV